MKYNPDKNSGVIRKWLGRDEGNVRSLLDFMGAKGHKPHGIAHAISGQDFVKFRKETIKKFKIK